jgi:hypothetical protein
MTSVGQLYAGFQWAEPLEGNRLRVERVQDELSITGLLPRYSTKDHPSDLIRQYELARVGRQSGSKNSPHIRFANADTDDRLIAFVRVFGPVVAISSRGMGGDDYIRVTARQDLPELRNEQVIYRAAFELLQELRKKSYSDSSAQCLIQEIAEHIGDWQKQWQREKFQRKGEPTWKFPLPSIQRIQGLSVEVPDLVRRVRDLLPPLLPPEIDARIVICELVNCFPGTVFPNPAEMRDSIMYGIRPLLYSLLRREFLHPHWSAICANKQCREFFEIERSGQRFCDSECSRQQRQRDYWEKHGKQLRKKRRKKKTK